MNVYREGYRVSIHNKKCNTGINDIATTHPYLVKYFVNKQDSLNNSVYSSIKTRMKCPECGFEKSMIIFNLSRQGFSCPRCGDGVSYPNKFVSNFLSQIIQFECEKVFEWSNNKRYDHYIENTNCIIENHGRQHYEHSTRGRSLEEELENDRLKEKLAKENGVEHYIVLDCRHSDMEWIKNSIMGSELPKLLNFNEEDIDWVKCDEYATKNLIKAVCMEWNNKNTAESTIDIAKKFHISRDVVRKYLIKGMKFGWCYYNGKQEQRLSLKFKNSGSNNKASRKVVCENKVFSSAIECSVYYNEKYYNIVQWCSRKRNMPLEWYNKGLRYQDLDLSLYRVQQTKTGKNSICSKKVICGDLLFNSVRECAENYSVNKGTLWAWIAGKNPMPQKYIDLGLRYATEEDLKLYKEAC